MTSVRRRTGGLEIKLSKSAAGQAVDGKPGSKGPGFPAFWGNSSDAPPSGLVPAQLRYL